MNDKGGDQDLHSQKYEAIRVLKTGISITNTNYDISHLPEDDKSLLTEDRYLPNESTRMSSVLVILRYCDTRAKNDCWDVLLTLRPNHMRFHKGLVCLPGGKLEQGETPVSGALREANVSNPWKLFTCTRIAFCD